MKVLSTISIFFIAIATMGSTIIYQPEPFLKNNLIKIPDSASGGVSKSWVKNNFYQQSYIDKNYYPNDVIDKDFYTKKEAKNKFYTQDYINQNYYTGSKIDNDFYTIDQADKQFYAQSYIDENYYNKNNTYSKAETDSKFVKQGDALHWDNKKIKVDIGNGYNIKTTDVKTRLIVDTYFSSTPPNWLQFKGDVTFNNSSINFPKNTDGSANIIDSKLPDTTSGKMTFSFFDNSLTSKGHTLKVNGTKCDNSTPGLFTVNISHSDSYKITSESDIDINIERLYIEDQGAEPTNLFMSGNKINLDILPPEVVTTKNNEFLTLSDGKRHFAAKPETEYAEFTKDNNLPIAINEGSNIELDFGKGGKVKEQDLSSVGSLPSWTRIDDYHGASAMDFVSGTGIVVDKWASGESNFILEMSELQDLKAPYKIVIGTDIENAKIKCWDETLQVVEGKPKRYEAVRNTIQEEHILPEMGWDNPQFTITYVAVYNQGENKKLLIKNGKLNPDLLPDSAIKQSFRKKLK